LTYLQRAHGIPDYVLVVLKAAGYDRKESIERAVFGDPAKFCDNLQKYARKLMESKDYVYYQDFKISYEISCTTIFRSDMFEILPGHLDLLIAIISDNKV
jgi:hypothetical protein